MADKNKSKPSASSPPVLTSKEFAAAHKVHRHTVLAACASGILKFKKDRAGRYLITDGPQNRRAFANRPKPGRKRSK